MTRRIAVIWLLLAVLTLARLNAIEAIATEARAKALVQAHQFQRARLIYSQLLAKAPDNVDYLVWIGRLSGYMADYPAAAKTYRAALAQKPDNVEALVGYAYILLWTGDYTSADTLLARAKILLPDSSDVEIALARKAFYQDLPIQAQQHAALALKLDPLNQDAREFSGHLQSLSSTSYTLRSTQDLFSFGSPARQITLEASHRFAWMNAGLSIQDWSRFGQHTTRIGFAMNRNLSKGLFIEGSSYFGSRGDFVARRDQSLTLNKTLNSRFLASLGYRNLAFDNARVNVFAPSLTYYFNDTSSLRVSANRSWTSYSNAASRALPANTYSFLYGERLSRRTSLTTGFSTGSEYFPALQSQRPGVYSAQTYSGSVRFPTSRSSSMRVDYSYQKRSTGVWQQSVGTSIVVDR